MLIVLVYVHVKPEFIEAFNVASMENAEKSCNEPGIARFDLIQDLTDPTRFVLIEVYRTQDDPAAHKITDHYARWRDVVEPMMAEPRTSKKYANLSPDDGGW